MPPAVVLRGQRELLAALAKADKQTRLGVRRELRNVAEPVKRDASALALSTIRRMTVSPKWAGMRIGITRKLVYVAPRQRGTRGRTRASRPNLANLLMDRAMQPALERNEHNLEARLGEALDRMANDFN